MPTNPLLAVLLLVAVAILVVAGMLALPYLFAPRRQTPTKQMPYESGMDPIGDARGRFDVRFYLVAIVFLLFDVELLFLYPWAVAAWNPAGLAAAEAEGAAAGADGLRPPARWIVAEPYRPGLVFAEMLVFVGLLGLAYLYAWRKGVFNWK